MNPPKLAQLRAKTNRQLVAVISRRLDAGLEFARHALPLQARKAQCEASGLMLLVDTISQAEKSRLESKLARLEDAIGESATLCVQTASY